MKKITGKALSLVLSIALVASSFSASFASASTKTVSGSVDLKKDDAKVIYLVSGGADKDSGVNLTDWIAKQQAGGDPTSMDTPDHQNPTVDQILDVSHVSGDRLVKWGNAKGSSISDDDNDPCYLFLKNKTGDGKEVISVLYKGTYQDDDGNDVNVKAKAEITVHVIKEGTILIGKGYSNAGTDLSDRTGKSIEDIGTLASKTDDEFADPIMGSKDSAVDSAKVGVYAAYDAADGNILVNYVPVPTYFDCATKVGTVAKDDTNGTYTTDAVAKEKAADFTVKVTGSTANKCDLLPSATESNLLTIYSKDGVSTGSVSFTVSNSSKNADLAKNISISANSKLDDSKVTAKTTVAKKAIVRKATSITKDKKTLLKVYGSTDTLDITGYDLKLDDSFTSSFNIDKDCSVGVISGGKGMGASTTLNISSATTGKLDLDDAFAGKVIINDSKVGDVNAKKGAADISGTSTVGNVKCDGEITVSSGNVGDIESDTADVTINANDDDKTTNVGTVQAKLKTSIDNGDSKVVAKCLLAKDDTSTIELSGNNITATKIDMDYRKATLSIGDFQGKLPAPVNGKNATIETTDDDADVTFTGAATVDSLSLNDSSKVTFDTSLKAGDITGSGTIKLPLGSLYVTSSVSGSPVLKFSNDFKVGDTAFKADSDSVDVDDFDGFGFTVTKSAGSTIDTFKIASAKFAGLLITPSSARIAKGTQYAQTFKASAYPSGTVIPSGDKVAWDFSGSDTNFKYTANADGTYTVEVIAVDPTFASENEGKVIAKLVDENGDEDTDYTETDCAVTALAVPDATFTSDTGATLTVAQGASYTFKITTLDGKEPTFSVGSNAFSVTKVGKSGNAYFYKITATGAVKTSVGVYVNGVRSTVATIGASAVKIDTTKLSLKTGASYTFKVSGTTVAPSFTSGNTAVVKVVSSSASAGSYFFKVSGVKAGSTGIYVNGVRAAVVTVA
jgi:hypothetical protein